MKLTKDERIILTLIVLVIIILASLYATLSFIEPKKIQIYDLKNNVGNYVEVEGVVCKVKSANMGEIIEICDEKLENRAQAYLSFKEDILPGESVLVRGMVRDYRGTIELMVSDSKDLKVLSKAYRITLEQLLTNPQIFVGMNVEIYGNMSTMRPTDYLEVSDGFNFLKVYIKGGYIGERDVYLHGRYSNGIFQVDRISLNYSGPCVKLTDLKEGNEVWIHVTIVSHFYYGYLEWKGYSVKVLSDRPLSREFVVLKARFIYSERTGAYELVVE